MLLEKIKSKLHTGLNIESLEIIDDSHKHAHHRQSSGGHFKVIITSNDFKDKSLIERHRMVYAILDEMLKKEIHALSIEARTIEE